MKTTLSLFTDAIATSHLSFIANSRMTDQQRRAMFATKRSGVSSNSIGKIKGSSQDMGSRFDPKKQTPIQKALAGLAGKRKEPTPRPGLLVPKEPAPAPAKTVTSTSTSINPQTGKPTGPVTSSRLIQEGSQSSYSGGPMPINGIPGQSPTKQPVTKPSPAPIKAQPIEKDPVEPINKTLPVKPLNDPSQYEIVKDPKTGVISYVPKKEPSFIDQSLWRSGGKPVSEPSAPR